MPWSLKPHNILRMQFVCSVVIKYMCIAMIFLIKSIGCVWLCSFLPEKKSRRKSPRISFPSAKATLEYVANVLREMQEWETLDADPPLCHPFLSMHNHNYICRMALQFTNHKELNSTLVAVLKPNWNLKLMVVTAYDLNMICSRFSFDLFSIEHVM